MRVFGRILCKNILQVQHAYTREVGVKCAILRLGAQKKKRRSVRLRLGVARELGLYGVIGGKMGEVMCFGECEYGVWSNCGLVSKKQVHSCPAENSGSPDTAIVH